MKGYFDNSATTRPYNEVIEVMTESLKDNFGNPSSMHRLGMKAEKSLKDARGIFSDHLFVQPSEIYFTSGGTESNNLAVLGAAELNKRLGNKVITTKIEHPSVLNTMKELEKKGYHVVYIDVNEKGLIDMETFKKEMDEETILVSVMYVNNEVGTIQPIKEIGQYIKKKNSKTKFHVDAIQGFGKIQIRPYDEQIDLLSFSGHKFHGPKGIGGLYIKKDCKIKPIIFGGNQENGMRSGTENVSGILGMAKACQIIFQNFGAYQKKLEDLKTYFWQGVEKHIGNAQINGYGDSNAAPHILNISFLGIKGEILLHLLEQDEIYVSTGSACASNKKGHSHVLKAMKFSEQGIEGAIRFSFSTLNTYESIDFAIKRLEQHVEYIRNIIMR